LRHDGRGGIRTHGTLLTYTHFPGVRLKPLGHPSRHRYLALAIEGLRSGQGEIRTLDTGFTGMPVFETGAFNHSATCPAGSQTIGRRDLVQPDAVPRNCARSVAATITARVDQRIGTSNRTLEIVVVDGSRLGVRYGLSTFDISRRIL
jgi:hypothetical protein